MCRGQRPEEADETLLASIVDVHVRKTSALCRFKAERSSATVTVSRSTERSTPGTSAPMFEVILRICDSRTLV